MGNKFWEDFSIGDEVDTQAITITEAHLVNWAGLTMDYYPLHMDEEYAKTTIFRGRIAHGPLIFSMAIGLVYLSGIYGDSIVAWLGVENMKLPAPVRIGDSDPGSCTGVREARDKKSRAGRDEIPLGSAEPAE